MAPEVTSLKRKRSRPSDYWIVNPVASPQLAVEAPKKRIQGPSSSGSSQRKIGKNSTVGNRGRSARGSRGDGEKGDARGSGSAEVVWEKIRRRGRSSNTENGLKSSQVASTSREGIRGVAAESSSSAITPLKRAGRPAIHKSNVLAGLDANSFQGSMEKGKITRVSGGVEKPAVDAGAAKQSKLRFAPLRSSNTDQVDGDQGRRRTRQSEAQNILAEQPTGSASLNNALQNKQLEMNGPIRSREVVTAVEKASSKLTKGKPKPKPRVLPKDPPIAKNPGKAAPPSRLSKVGKTSKATPQKKMAHNVSKSSQPKPSKRKEAQPGVEEQPNKRQRVGKQNHHEDEEVAEITPFPHLHPTTRKVSRLKIESKWQPLPRGSIDLVAEFLSDLQNPVIARLKDDRKKTQVHSLLKSISRRLLKKMAMGLPFPPVTSRSREDDFDYEKIIDQNRALESQLTPAMHANELLEAELRKEMARLESDEQNLADLEANAKKEAGLRTQGSQRQHAVLQTEASLNLDELQLDMGWRDTQIYQSLDATLKDDEQVRRLANSLSDHMESIQGNIKQVDGIAEALAMAKAAVQAKLFERLDGRQYEAMMIDSD